MRKITTFQYSSTTTIQDKKGIVLKLSSKISSFFLKIHKFIGFNIICISRENSEKIRKLQNSALLIIFRLFKSRICPSGCRELTPNGCYMQDTNLFFHKPVNTERAPVFGRDWCPGVRSLSQKDRHKKQVCLLQGQTPRGRGSPQQPPQFNLM